MKVKITTPSAFSVSVGNQATQNSVVTNTPGATGLPGKDGVPGSVIYSGYPADNAIGIAGDYWFDTVNKIFIGPKTTVWPSSGTSFVLNYITETIHIDQTMISAKGLFLRFSPVSEVFLNILGGTSQKQNVDFHLTTNFLSWDALGMEPLMDTSTVVSVQYPY